ncbi:MAG: CRISPR-associated endonuclease Cas2 [Candidatus Wallbacteria bacterium]|nr:CRISPR-associated endonuclease Cas2 [Candidatus Wallbacteria bacterium]
MSQLVWVVYDVTSDRVRKKVADLCKRYGLYRVQKSVFLGKLEKSRLDELALSSEKLIDETTDSVYMFPLCESDFKRVKLLGHEFDRELVQDRIRAVVV